MFITLCFLYISAFVNEASTTTVKQNTLDNYVFEDFILEASLNDGIVVIDNEFESINFEDDIYNIVEKNAPVKLVSPDSEVMFVLDLSQDPETRLQDEIVSFGPKIELENENLSDTHEDNESSDEVQEISVLTSFFESSLLSNQDNRPKLIIYSSYIDNKYDTGKVTALYLEENETVDLIGGLQKPTGVCLDIKHNYLYIIENRFNNYGYIYQYETI